MTDHNEALETARRALRDAVGLAPAQKAQVVKFVGGVRSKLRGFNRRELDQAILVSLGITREQMRVYELLPDTELLRRLGGGPVKPAFSEAPEGWIRDYLTYTQNQESPTEFHFWVAVSVIGACLGRRVTFDKGYYRVVPNHYVLLVSPPGRCRRSVATRIGIDLLRSAQTTTRIIGEKVTPEGLLVTLQAAAEISTNGTAISRGSSTAIVHAPELSVFLGRQQYNEGMIALLTTLYDSPDDPFEYITRTKESLTIPPCALSMLGASAPDWLAESLPQVAFGGGFLSRIIIVHRENTDRVVAIPKPPPGGWKEKLVAGLRTISSLTGFATMDEEATGWYEDWYEDTKDSIPDDMRLSGYYERKQDHLIRLAIVLSAAGGGGLVLTRPILERSLAYLEGVEPELPRAFRQIGATPIGRHHDRILAQIERAGGVMPATKWLQMNSNYMDRKQFREMLATLLQEGYITGPEEGNLYRLVKRHG